MFHEFNIQILIPNFSYVVLAGLILNCYAPFHVDYETSTSETFLVFRSSGVLNSSLEENQHGIILDSRYHLLYLLNVVIQIIFLLSSVIFS